MSLMIEIERCIRRTGLHETRFGRLAVNDPRLIGDIRRGRCLGPAVTARVRAFIAAQQQ